MRRDNPNLEEGTYVLWLVPRPGQSWLRQYWAGKNSLETATPIVVAGSGTVTEITAELVRGGEITGRILDAEGHPYARGSLAIQVEFADAFARPVILVADEDYDPATGEYRARGLHDGDLVVRAAPSSGGYVYYPGTTVRAEAEPVTIVDAGTRTGIDFTVAGAAR
ncbi:MAG: hypothetical protein R6X25_04685 [Candidatus Krumholzibacteriia bacterium]